jgi:toxin ParE1/3/4
MRLRVSNAASADLDAIFDYWAERASPDVAARLLYSLRDRFLLLAESADIGRDFADLAPGVRVFPAGKYLINYRKVRGTLQILQIVHGARDRSQALRKDEG